MALTDLLDTKEQGALFRSQFQNIVETAALSSFFFSLEKLDGQSKLIHSLLSDTGQELIEPGQPRRPVCGFYSSLYSSEYKEKEKLFEEFCEGLPQVLEGTNEQLDRPL